eukprot:1821844-Pyramimonas_sp.AAC.1
MRPSLWNDSRSRWGRSIAPHRRCIDDVVMQKIERGPRSTAKRRDLPTRPGLRQLRAVTTCGAGL